MGGGVTVIKNGDIRERLTAIRLRLENPEQFTKSQALVLAELIKANLADHVESGTLLSAFDKVTVLTSSKGYSAVGVGDPNILTKPHKAPRGTIMEFVLWLRQERGKRWQGFKARWAGVKAQREKIAKKAKEARAKVRIKQAAKARKPKPLSAKRYAQLGKQIKAQRKHIRKYGPGLYGKQILAELIAKRSRGKPKASKPKRTRRGKTR